MFDVEKARLGHLRGQRLKTLTQMAEWSEFLAIVKEEYDTNWKKLMKSEDSEARGALKAIDRILSKVQDNKKFGESCAKELWDRTNQKN